MHAPGATTSPTALLGVRWKRGASQRQRGGVMTVIARTDPEFAFAGLDTPQVGAPEAVAAAAAAPDPLGPLGALAGTWKGHGVNAIWRPHRPPNPPTDRFLELNSTGETLAFTRINGP